ncbi:MAG: hypothetical protein WCS28_12100, partial [Thiomicrospira sp.]
TLDALGTTDMDYALTVNASNVGNLSITSLATKNQAITLDASQVVGTVGVTGVINAGAGDVNVNVNGTSGAVTLGGAITGKNVTIDATNALGGVTYTGAINVGNAFTLNGANLQDNDLSTGKVIATGTSLTATLNGGLGDDKVTIDAAAGGTKITVAGDLGLEATAGTGNNLTVNGGAGNDEINVSSVVVSSLDAARGVTIVGAAGDDKITVTAGTNTITGGKGQDTITLGTGDDTVVIASGDAGKTAATIDIISGFLATGADKLKLGTAGSTTNYAEVDLGAAAASTVADALVAADAAMDGTVRFVLVENQSANGAAADGSTLDFQNDSILFIDFNLDGTADAAVGLVGKVAANIAFGDIIA